MKLLLLDNYDSFTYNLVHYLEGFDIDIDIEVVRNDQITIEDIERFDKILISPGPGIPVESGITTEVIKVYSSKKPILGICLGHQAIAEVFGGSLVKLEQVMHGVATQISVTVQDEILFKDMPTSFKVGRYHSWVVNPIDFPAGLEVTSLDAQGNIMSLRHRVYDVRAVQFHPESIMTEYGKQLLKNWVEAE